jgi:Na+/phosphate symporter
MTEQNFTDINWTAAFIGFGVDWVFSEVVGIVVMTIMLVLKGIGLDSDDNIPADVLLARQIVGVIGALLGGVVAGYLARRRGALHGVLGSVIGLFTLLCTIPILGGLDFNVGDLGFVVLNLVGAG